MASCGFVSFREAAPIHEWLDWDKGQDVIRFTLCILYALSLTLLGYILWVSFKVFLHTFWSSTILNRDCVCVKGACVHKSHRQNKTNQPPHGFVDLNLSSHVTPPWNSVGFVRFGFTFPQLHHPALSKTIVSNRGSRPCRRSQYTNRTALHNVIELRLGDWSARFWTS